MELSKQANKTEECKSYKLESLSETVVKQIAMLALMDALNTKENNDYESGPKFPNIPFGD